ncbi:hypothetical protein [Alienimonas chondri]|uniref:Phage tail protein n=1 Tax=Alienimonas chondri TaxID=2681879 RepID=A0ABX1VKT4_9PLAN|nr:hypothetical protein [Alienimonas chondri]NNJ27995.1 hypothetical protein [Alienimonas chondri]
MSNHSPDLNTIPRTAGELNAFAATVQRMGERLEHVTFPGGESSPDVAIRTPPPVFGVKHVSKSNPDAVLGWVFRSAEIYKKATGRDVTIERSGTGLAFYISEWSEAIAAVNFAPPTPTVEISADWLRIMLPLVPRSGAA